MFYIFIIGKKFSFYFNAFLIFNFKTRIFFLIGLILHDPTQHLFLRPYVISRDSGCCQHPDYTSSVDEDTASHRGGPSPRPLAMSRTINLHFSELTAAFVKKSRYLDNIYNFLNVRLFSLGYTVCRYLQYLRTILLILRRLK